MVDAQVAVSILSFYRNLVAQGGDSEHETPTGCRILEEPINVKPPALLVA